MDSDEDGQQSDKSFRKRMNQSDEHRARSLGPSRSRARGSGNPSELFARKQQILSSSSQIDSWALDQTQETGDSELTTNQQHRRSLTRRAKQQPHLRSKPDHESSISQSTRATSNAEAKLESLSEMLKSHQNDQNLTSNQENSKSIQDAMNNKSIDDLYIILAKKEKDLQLAAELGKVLLEKNDELSKANERITEEYSHKLELLEQDKHKLKRKLDQLDGEYENRVIELQTDCNILKNQLEDQRRATKQVEKEKLKLIDDLVQQNQRLTSELVEATKSEELLSKQLEQTNDRFNVRMSNRQDHVVQVDALKEEISIVNQRKQDLERRLKLAQNEKHNLSSALDESGDKILLLENLLNERDNKLSELVDECNELRDSSSWLSNELEAMISLNEKIASFDDCEQLSNPVNQLIRPEQQVVLDSHLKRSQIVEQLKQLRLKNRSRIKTSEMMLLNRRAKLPLDSSNEISNRKQKRNLRVSRVSNSPDSNNLSQGYYEDEHSNDSPDPSDEWNEELVSEVYSLLRRFQSDLQVRKANLQSMSSSIGQQHLYTPNSTDDSGISTDDGGPIEQSQARDPAHWRRLLESLKFLIEEMPCSTCQLMISERADYEQLQKVYGKLCEEVRMKNDQLLALSMARTDQEAKMKILEEKCHLLSGDLENCDKPKEEIVKLAWKARDEAVERKNAAEISLAKTRIENMQIASQLMEVVQQKGELSQKLAQFEDDILKITQDSVKAKFTWEEYAEKLRRSKTTQADSISGHSNPLAQLLGFSMPSYQIGGRANGTSKMAANSSSPSQVSANGNDSNSSNIFGSKSSTLDSLTNSGGLMRNFTSNRFNLRFWQRGSTEKPTETTTTTATMDKSVPGNNGNGHIVTNSETTAISTS